MRVTAKRGKVKNVNSTEAKAVFFTCGKPISGLFNSVAKSG